MINLNSFDFDDKKGPKHYHCWKSFSYFLNGLELLSSVKTCDENQLKILEESFEYTNLPAYYVKSLFRDGYKHGTLNFSNFDDGRVIYLSRCLGHKISESKLLRFPRLCVLYSLRILKDRWKYAEDAIVTDDVAAYFYSKYVIVGRLPEKMHSQIVLNTFLCKSPAIEKYFEYLQRKNLCYN